MVIGIRSMRAGGVLVACVFAAATILLPTHIYAVGSSLDLPGKSAEETIQIAKHALERLDANCIEQDITLGAQWRCKTPFYSPLNLDIFVSTIPDKSIIRADSRTRQSYAFVDLVANETGQPPYEQSYAEKSVLLSLGATLVSPALGYWYANSNTMIKAKSVFLPLLGFLAGDLALFWVSSKMYFTNGFDPFGNSMATMLISMGAYRAIMMLPFSLQVVAHNRFAGLKITYRF
ncbi:MAG: hypothetical protein JSR44_12495 [Spirochaetes bacterium]|nr:hypothetical protein [Spirochaetota bacterium]